MKKVYVHAYCKMNIGDDMFVLSLVRRYPAVGFYTCAQEEYRRAIADETNLYFVSDASRQTNPLFKKLARISDQLKHRFIYDAFVRIGGSLFMEPLNWKKKKPYPNWMCRLLNKNKFVIGSNFGPCYTKEFFERAFGSLRCYKGICLRDKHSYELFKSISCVRCAPDVLFGYEGYPEIKAGSGVGVSIIALEKKQEVDKYSSAYYRKIAQVCDALVERSIPVKLFAFCKAEGDEDAVNAVLSEMKSPESVTVCLYDGDIGKTLDEFNDCEYIFATRFHAMIFGFVLNKKVLPVIYSKKQTDVLADMDFLGSVWNLLGGEMPDAQELISRCFNNPQADRHEIQKMKLQAKEQFSQIDEYLQ